MVPPHAPFTYAHYRYILNSALENGYRFIDFPELAHDRAADRICLLRHDCDNDLTAAATLAAIEHEMGVRSTYFLMLRSALYNLMAIPNARLVREIIACGHWIGLHFDETFYHDSTTAQIAGYVDQERDWLARETGAAIQVVSFHQPSGRVLNNEIKLNCLNTYDRTDMQGVYYLSDSNTVWQEGCPSEFFQARRHPRLQLLLHPEWWTAEEKTVQQKWQQMLTNNFALLQGSMLARERAYTIPHQILFRAAEAPTPEGGEE